MDSVFIGADARVYTMHVDVPLRALSQKARRAYRKLLPNSLAAKMLAGSGESVTLYFIFRNAS